MTVNCLDPDMARNAKGIKMERYLRENTVIKEARLGQATVMVYRKRVA